MSHPADLKHNKPEIPLIDHLTSVADASKKIASSTSFENKNLVYYAGLFHDLGKLGPYYQKLFSDPSQIKQNKPLYAKDYDNFHSIYSGWIASKILAKEDMDIKKINKIMMMIYCHHGSMSNSSGRWTGGDTETSRNKNRETKKALIENWQQFKAQYSENQHFKNLYLNFELQSDANIKSEKELKIENSANYLEEFVELEYLFSVLLRADKSSFGDFEQKIFDCKIDTSKIGKKYTSLKTYRTRFQEHVADQINPDEPITIINAPTGIGKTKAFFDAIEKFNPARIFYFSPLLALTNDIEKKIINEKILDPDTILTYNHVYSGLLTDKNNENSNREYNIDHEAFNEKFIITTMQRLLMTLYSNKSRDKLKLASFANALLIIDEVQTLPKFLLKNLCELFSVLNKRVGTKVIMLSATIPYELSGIFTIKPEESLKKEYIESRNRKIEYQEKLNLGTVSVGQNLVMLNTRKNAIQKFNELKEKFDDTYYITSGIIKKHQKQILEKLEGKIKDNKDVILVSTQVIEAGVDISFTNIWRQMSPLDSIVQILGRLDRENTNSSSTLYIFDSQENIPYSTLEYQTSQKYIKEIKDTVSLYDKLDDYYKEISLSHETQKNDLNDLENYMQQLDFKKVWYKIREKIDDNFHDSIYVPNIEQWEKVKDDLLSGKKWRIKKHADLQASLPKKSHHFKEFFDEELLEKNILFPKKEKLFELYDDVCGLDKWIL